MGRRAGRAALKLGARAAGAPLAFRPVLAEDFSLLVYGVRRLMPQRLAKSVKRPEVRH